eukprot:1389738-Amphidinium_carterae.1
MAASCNKRKKAYQVRGKPTIVNHKSLPQSRVDDQFHKLLARSKTATPPDMARDSPLVLGTKSLCPHPHPKSSPDSEAKSPKRIKQTFLKYT